MTSKTITLQDILEMDKLLNKEQFRDQSILNYLGKDLKNFLSNFLDHLGLGPDEQKILGEVSPQATIVGRVFIAAGAVVEPTAMIQGPAYIGNETEVRHGAYIRGNVYVGKKCVVGHATEVKGSVFFDEAKAGHFAYVGDSILGTKVNLGAGTKLANLKLKRSEVMIRHPEGGEKIPTGLSKMGAIMGHEAQTGCNAVLSPGTVLLPGAIVGPCEHAIGTISGRKR